MKTIAKNKSQPLNKKNIPRKKSGLNKTRDFKSSPHSTCPPSELALKSFFLGPQSENAEWLFEQIQVAFKKYFNWRKSLFPKDGNAISAEDKKNKTYKLYQKRMQKNFFSLLKKLEKETPKFTPRYIGHMVSEISTPALLGNIATLLHNPNNVSAEVSKVGLKLEKESISLLAQMIGFDPYLASGHFTSGGTIANIEALWRARFHFDNCFALAHWMKQKNLEVDLYKICHLSPSQFKDLKKSLKALDSELKEFSFVANSPWAVAKKSKNLFDFEFQGPLVLVPGNKHYSWMKAVSLLGLGESSFCSIPLDSEGRLDLFALKKIIQTAQKNSQPILAIVSVAGTTELGEVDPIDTLQDYLDYLYKKENLFIWHHIDAAYGGYYCSILRGNKHNSLLDKRTLHALSSISRSQSVTLDPHKLGYVPYSCGALLLKNSQLDQVTSFHAPYLVQDQENKSWSATLEGSRSAVGAAATWMSASSIHLNSQGYGKILEKGILSRIHFVEILKKTSPMIQIIEPIDTNIICFCVARSGESLSKVNKRSLKIYNSIHEGNDFSVSKTQLSISDYKLLIQKHVQKWNGQLDSDNLTLVRIVLMNPFIESKEFKTPIMHSFSNLILKFCD